MTRGEKSEEGWQGSLMKQIVSEAVVTLLANISDLDASDGVGIKGY